MSKVLSVILAIGFVGMFVIAQVCVQQRDEARKVTAEFQGKTLVCRFEEKH
ncbi:hypothetical protein [Pseudomonas putida]|uniref:hypothetical protein n=1 Tax=Pseudomonas putida TaxID=303 RepID=UPI0039E06FC4